MENQPDKRRWLGLVVISVAVSLIIVDSTIVNVAIPAVVDELDITSTQVQWVQESYTLVFAALLLVFGTIADRIGRRRMLLLGVFIFAASSVLAALAGSGEVLIASRVIQGVGGAMILPTTLSLVNANFQGRERGIAFAIWGSTIGGMAAVGPLLGGWLTTAFSWRWAFGINVPLGILIVLGAILWVRESKAPQPGRLDLVGAAISVVLFTSFVFGLIEGRTFGWWESDDVPEWWTLDVSPIPFIFGLAVVALVAFIAWGLHRQKQGKSTMIAFSLFRLTSFRNGNITALLVSLGEFGVILSFPLWLQNALGYDALHVGFLLLTMAGGSFLASGAAGSMVGKVAPVWTVRMGLISEIVGLLLLFWMISLEAEWWQLGIGLAIYGFGVGLATAQLTGVILADVPLEQSGQASGTQSTSRQVGSALGIAILGTVLFGSLGGSLEAKLPDTLPEEARDQIVEIVVDSAGAAIPGLEEQSPEIAQLSREAFTDAARWNSLTAAGFLTIGLLATLSLGASAARRDGGQEGVGAEAEAEAETSGS